MTEQPNYSYPAPYTTPPKPKRNWKRFALPAGLLVLGLIIGSAGAGSAEPEVITETVTETVEKRVEVPVEKRVEVKVPVTPASCLEALTLNEEAFDTSAAALNALAQRNSAAFEAAMAEMKALTPKVNAAKAQCRNS